MNDEILPQGSRELDLAIASAKQNITLLRRQLKTGRIDASYFDQRLESLTQLITDLEGERRDVGQQRRFAALYEVSKAIGSSLNLQTVLDQVMDAIIRLTAAERGFLMLLDDDGKLSVKVARNFDQETLADNDIAFSRTITRQVFESGAPVVTTNAQEDPRYAGQASIIAHSMRSIMASPLRARGQNIGVVYVDNRVRTALFGEADLTALEAFAAQAGVAIDNARLHADTDAQLQARLEELQILQWIDRQLNESLDPERTIQLTIEWSSRLCKAETASIGFIDHEAGVVHLTANYGENNEFEKSPEMPLANPLIAQVLNTQKAALQISTPDIMPPQTILCVPIRLENAVSGVMLFSANRPDTFGTDAQALVARMADRAAIALQNARLYAAVKAADRAKTEFISLVAHELKVPMTSIRGYASMIGLVAEINDQQKEFVKVITNNVERMKILVEDLTDISRIETGQLRIDLRSINILDVLKQAKDGVITQIDERGHTLKENIAPDLPMVLADQARLVQVLVNLLSNAYKYTPNGGIITLSASRHDDSVMISVQDNGIGMTPEQLAKLGTKFYRVSENEHVQRQSGTGLGFAITRNLIELMHGTLEIESQTGAGSTFRFSLPADPQPASR